MAQRCGDRFVRNLLLHTGRVPIMAQQGGGRVVSISMTLHYRGWPRWHTHAGKGGVDALTRTLAVEWAPQKIRVNAMRPVNPDRWREGSTHTSGR